MSQPLKLLRVAALAAAIMLAGGPARAWGPIAHQAVNAHAIDTLPKGLKPFYKNHRLEMPSLSPEATPSTRPVLMAIDSSRRRITRVSAYVAPRDVAVSRARSVRSRMGRSA